MARRLFTLLSAASLALCALVVGLWARSAQAADVVEFRHGGRLWRATSDCGQFRVDDAPQVEADAAANKRRLRVIALLLADVRDDLQTCAFEETLVRAVARGRPGQRDDGVPRDVPWVPGTTAVVAAVDSIAACRDREEIAWYVRRRATLTAKEGRLAAEATVLARPVPLTEAVAVSHRWLTAGLATLPSARLVAFAVRGRRRRRRSQSGLCPACGYDLRATPGRCPEYGAEPKGAMA